MNSQTPDQNEEPISFPHGWNGLYVFVILYGFVQVLLLYFLTRILNG